MQIQRHAAITALVVWTLTASAQTTGRVALDDLGGLHIDKTEVTIAQFARYV